MQAAGQPRDLSKITPVMMDLAVLAAICDTNRVIFMKMPAGRVFRFLGINSRFHGSLSHRIGNAGMGGACVANAIDMIHAIDKWYAQQFAYLVGRLDSITEGDRKLLDNTATVWFNEHVGRQRATTSTTCRSSRRGAAGATSRSARP